MRNTGLRASLIWHDEVMGDVVLDKPAVVTIGGAEGATFTAPVPAQTIVTPGRRGYLLTLSTEMSGVVCLGGVEHDVAAWVRAGEEPGGFRATPIGGNDWGVIALDASGDHKLFFQFVELEEAEWNLGHPMILAAVGGFALSVAALTSLFWWKDVPIGEAAFRAGSLSSLAIGLAAVVRWLLQQDNESRASLAFSVMLHAAILFAGFQLLDSSKGFEWPEQPSHSGGYLVKAEEIQPAKPEPAKKPTVTDQAKPGAALPVRQGWTRPTGKKVEKPSTRIATAVKPTPETGRAQLPGTTNEAPKIGVLVHEDVLHDVLGRDTRKAMQKIGELGGGDGGPGAPPGAGGPGTTKGGGDGKGPVGQRKGTGEMDTGGLRPSVCVGAGCNGTTGEMTVLPPPKDPPSGAPTITATEIDRVIKSHQGMFVACYQKALDKNPALTGDVTLHFEISTAGRVTSSSQSGGSLRDGNAVACMKRALGILQFPAKGGALVNYPFVFSAQ